MSKNKIVVPEAREAMDRFKMEAAAEVGVNLKQGYNCLLYTSYPRRGQKDFTASLVLIWIYWPSIAKD